MGVALALALSWIVTLQAPPADASSVLCKVNTFAACGPENTWPIGSEFKVATENTYVVFELGPTKQRCGENSSSLVTEGTNAEGNVYGTWRSLVFNKCEAQEMTYCQGAEARNLPWKVVFKAGAEPSKNRIVVSSSGKGEPRIRISCNPGLPVTCTYGAVAEFEIGMPAPEGQSQIWVEVLLGLEEKTSTWCNSYTELKWLANYNSISPTVYLTH